ncbi:MAG: PIN domain-containing protein [Acidobacteriota bacterium]|nr:PIN domain-containing protein [Acidobacteriota bacterium]
MANKIFPNKVFVDTAAWLSLFNLRDGSRPAAMKVMSQLRLQKRKLITSEFVILELADGLSKPPFRSNAFGYIEGIRKSEDIEIIPLSRDLLNQAWNLYCQRPDKGWGLTDCTSFIVMEQEQISEAFTSDRHFEQAGFTKLL